MLKDCSLLGSQEDVPFTDLDSNVSLNCDQGVEVGRDGSIDLSKDAQIEDAEDVQGHNQFLSANILVVRTHVTRVVHVRR